MSESINDQYIRNVFIDRNSIVENIHILKSIIRRDVTQSEISGFISFIKHQNFNTFKGVDYDTVRQVLANKFAERLSNRSGTVIDTHELLKRNIGNIPIHDELDGQGTIYSGRTPRVDVLPNVSRTITNNSDNRDNPGMRTHHVDQFSASPDELKTITRAVTGSLSSIYNEVRLVKDNMHTYSSYILLDSRYRKIDGNASSQISTYRWEFTPTVYTTQGTTNSISNIQNILYMQVQNFTIPLNQLTNNTYKRVSMLVEEFSALAIIAHEHRRYHYMFETEVDGNRVKLNPSLIDEGRYRFSTPITKIDQLSISFGSPLSPISFQPDRYLVSIIPINITETQILFSVNHDVDTGDIVILTGYNTSNPNIDVMRINAVNDVNGHVVNKVNSNTLSINVDLTTVTPLSSTMVECYITSRRILIPMRIVYANKSII